jgi:hypothetical protein
MNAGTLDLARTLFGAPIWDVSAGQGIDVAGAGAWRE